MLSNHLGWCRSYLVLVDQHRHGGIWLVSHGDVDMGQCAPWPTQGSIPTVLWSQEASAAQVIRARLSSGKPRFPTRMSQLIEMAYRHSWWTLGPVFTKILSYFWQLRAILKLGVAKCSINITPTWLKCRVSVSTLEIPVNFKIVKTKGIMFFFSLV